VHEVAKRVLHARARHEIKQEPIIFGEARNDAEIHGVALVTRAGVRATHQLHFQAAVTSTRSCGSISRRSISAGQNATISCTRGRPPAKPVTVGGPVRMSGASSRVKRSTLVLFSLRTPIRSSTSG